MYEERTKLVHRLMLISVQSFLEFFISLCQVIYNLHVSDSVWWVVMEMAGDKPEYAVSVLPPSSQHLPQ